MEHHDAIARVNSMPRKKKMTELEGWPSAESSAEETGMSLQQGERDALLLQAAVAVSRLEERLNALTAETKGLACEVREIKQFLFGDGKEGLKTTVALMQEWIEAEKEKAEQRRRESWQLKVAIVGWIVATAVTIASRLL